MTDTNPTEQLTQIFAQNLTLQTIAELETAKPPTNFFTLPLELRQEIFDYILHRDLKVECLVDDLSGFSPHYKLSRIFYKLKAADARLHAEMCEQFRRNCHTLHVDINHKPWEPPQKMTKYLNLKKVVIHIKHYNLYRGVKAQLDMMRENPRKAMMLLETRYSTLPELEVEFQDTGVNYHVPWGSESDPDDDYEEGRGDPHWTKEYKYSGDRLAAIKTGKTDEDFTTIYEYLLEPLYGVEMVFEKAWIGGLCGVYDPLQGALGNGSDKSHLWEKQEALRTWLE